MKGAQLSVEYLRVFRDLAETKSFSKAASNNHLTQSAVSQQVAFLERTLGKKLIERGSGKFALTEAGFILLEGGSSILNAYQGILDKIQSKSGEVAGIVKVESAYSVGLYLLPPFVLGFMKKYPKVNLEIAYNRSDRICGDVLAGICDVGVVVFPYRNHTLIESIPFRKEKLVFVCSFKNALSQKKSVRLIDIGKEPFVTFHKDMRTRKIIDAIFRKHNIKLNIIHEFDNIETLKRSVEIGAGVSILPENTVLQECKRKTLRAVPIAGATHYRETSIILRKGKSHSKAVNTFVDWLGK